MHFEENSLKVSYTISTST